METEHIVDVDFCERKGNVICMPVLDRFGKEFAQKDFEVVCEVWGMMLLFD